MLDDPIAKGLAAGWQHYSPESLPERWPEFDVVIIGSGAGGGISAKILSKAGLSVLIIESGRLRSSRDFNLQEAQAYPDLYQEAASRKTKDKGIGILQGHCVGGSTTVNWTTSIRTPNATLQHWQDEHGLSALSEQHLQPYFEEAEQLLNISPWQVPPNANNRALQQGCEQLGWSHQVISRNVKGCWDLGYCGMGCPTNAKQSMLTTCIPQALEHNAWLLSGYQVWTLEHKQGRVTGLSLKPTLASASNNPPSFSLSAKHVVVAAGSINGPALMLRSKLPDPHQLIGKRTFLHPVLISGALMPFKVEGHKGAPQSVYSDQHLWPRQGLGYKLEVPPLHPILVATKLCGFGELHQQLMQQFNHLQVCLALLRDGFDAHSQGGQVELRDDGSALLDYPFNDYFWDGARRALLSMAELQFAAGAEAVYPLHEQAGLCFSWPEAKALIETLPMKALQTKVVSAHVMGGCPMGGDTQRSLVDDLGRYRLLENLSVIDGSILPTSLGANPQLTIYALALRASKALAQQLS